MSKLKRRPEAKPAAPAAATGIDWSEVVRVALGSALFAGLMTGAMHLTRKLTEEADAAADPDPEAAMPPADPVEAAEEEPEESTDDDLEEAPLDPAAQAAAILGVSLDATEDEIRAALRAHLTFSRLHPDHGGDAEEAKRLINAKNLLVARARARTASGACVG